MDGMYVAMRALGDPDAFLPTDVGVLRRLRALEHEGTPAEARAPRRAAGGPGARSPWSALGEDLHVAPCRPEALRVAEPGHLGGHRRQQGYGRLDCPAALRWIAKGHFVKRRVFFADEATAIAAGYRPCAVCMPDRYRVWKEGRLR